MFGKIKKGVKKIVDKSVKVAGLLINEVKGLSNNGCIGIGTSIIGIGMGFIVKGVLGKMEGEK